ncbi:hypothetical protein ACFQVC_41560 [Streptomyces monticola]|uniref:Alpha/beta hydrolase n=1 Tax=Streptomyces monticola TaxID=2666263 RepID=A0ABW2JYU1_9ACTN
MAPNATGERQRTQGAAAARAALGAALDECRPLLTSTGGALRVFPVEELKRPYTSECQGEFGPESVARCNKALKETGSRYDLPVPEFVWPAPEQPSSLEVALSNFLALEPGLWQALGAAPDPGEPTADLPERPAPPERRTVHAPGLPPFTAYSQGTPGAEAVLIVPPCGVPAALFRPWQEALGAGRRVLTYENPHLFDGWDQLPDPSGDFEQEVALAGAVLREYGSTRVHLVGVCGGAPIALALAVTEEHAPDIASLTVCHPDLNFGAGVQRSSFQKQFQGFLSEAAAGHGRARDILELFLDPNMLYGVPARLAPYILYPYGDARLFHRYARLNHSLMAYDASAAAARIGQRLKIITSRTDRMTHPAAAHHLHDTVRGSVLSERDSGSHHDILLPTAELFDEIEEFIAAGGRP